MVGESSSIQRSVVPGTVARFGWLVKSLTSLAGLLRQNICGQVALPQLREGAGVRDRHTCIKLP